MDVMYSMYFVFSYFLCPVYCSIDTNACQYVRIKKLLYISQRDVFNDLPNRQTSCLIGQGKWHHIIHVIFFGEDCQHQF